VRYEFGAYDLDGERFELRRAGAVVAVQRRVLDTIVWLIAHRDHVVTKEELVAGPWGGVAVTDAAVNQAIMLARKALQQCADDPVCITTVRGRGYRWTEAVRMSGGHASTPVRKSIATSLIPEPLGRPALPQDDAEHRRLDSWPNEAAKSVTDRPASQPPGNRESRPPLPTSRPPSGAPGSARALTDRELCVSASSWWVAHRRERPRWSIL